MCSAICRVMTTGMAAGAASRFACGVRSCAPARERVTTRQISEEIDAMQLKRRAFLATGLAASVGSAVAALAQQGAATPDRAGRGGGGRGRGPAPARTAKTTRMFKSPGLYPNALAVMTDGAGGLWIGQQKVTGQSAVTYGVPAEKDPDEAAWLVDWNGKLLKTITTHSRNTSGIAYGAGCVWMGANADPYGIFQVDMSSM